MAFHILANFLLSYQSFSYYFVEFFLYYNFNIQVEYIYCECLLLYGSPFQFRGGAVLYILILLCIITFFFHYECFFGLFRKSLPTPRSQRYFLLFSSKHSLSTLSYLEMGNWFFKIRCEVKWQPTPVFLPGESQGQGSLVGCRLWVCTESDTTEAT